MCARFLWFSLIYVLSFVFYMEVLKIVCDVLLFVSFSSVESSVCLELFLL